MLQVSMSNYDRITRINSVIEARLKIQTEKLEVEKQRFLRRMIRIQALLRSECKRLKDEKFRNEGEKQFLQQNKLGKSFQLDEMIETDGPLHSPGVQSRYTRNKNFKNSKRQNSSILVRKSNPILSSESREDLSTCCADVKDNQFRADGIHHQHSQGHPQNLPSWELTPYRVTNSQSAGLPSRKGIFSQNFQNTFSTSSSPKMSQEEQENQNNVLSRRRKRRQSRKDLYGRRHTAPFLDRIAQMKEQVVKEEAEYILRLRKESQRCENENVTQKVWEFIGKRPISAVSSFRKIASAKQSTKKNSRFDDLSDEENNFLLKRMTRMSK